MFSKQHTISKDKVNTFFLWKGSSEILLFLYLKYSEDEFLIVHNYDYSFYIISRINKYFYIYMDIYKIYLYIYKINIFLVKKAV